MKHAADHQLVILSFFTALYSRGHQLHRSCGRRPHTEIRKDYYFALPDFKRLEARMQRVRLQIIEHCVQEPIAPSSAETHENLPVTPSRRKASRVITARSADLRRAT